MINRFLKTTKAAALVEFSIGSLILILVILGTIEFGMEMYARNATERLTDRATTVYSLTRDLSKVSSVFDNNADSITKRCITAPEVLLFQEVVSGNIFDMPGTLATGTATDDTAVAFRINVTCDWPTIVPGLGNLLTTPGGHSSSMVARFRP